LHFPDVLITKCKRQMPNIEGFFLNDTGLVWKPCPKNRLALFAAIPYSTGILF
jgi:hypothetical protein